MCIRDSPCRADSAAGDTRNSAVRYDQQVCVVGKEFLSQHLVFLNRLIPGKTVFHDLFQLIRLQEEGIDRCV